MRPHRFSFGLGLAAAIGITSIAGAALLGVITGFPSIVYDNLGQTSYNASSQVLSVAASPLAIRFSPTTPPRIVNPTGNPPVRVLDIHVVVDAGGRLLGGHPAEDLLVVGEVDQDGDSVVDFSGTLLTGEISGFGHQDSGGTTDEMDFRFTVTGGSLAGFFENQDIGLKLTIENSSFTGSFSSNFAGGAKGVLGPIPLNTLRGCTPGYWKQPQHFDSWAAPYVPNTLFESVFQRDVPGNPTLVEALRSGGGGINALMRHTAAALLNAASNSVYPDREFDTISEVINGFRAAYDSGSFEPTKDRMEGSNELGCPLN